MSTKTTFKRIALATVAAMGFGLMSTSPAFAAAGDITAVTGTVSVSGGVITVDATYTGATDTLLAMAQANIGLLVVQSPDADLPNGTAITGSITNLVTVTTVRTNATTGTKSWVFDAKVNANAGLYQFRVYGTTDALAGASNAPTVTAAVNYNPPVLAGTEVALK